MALTDLKIRKTRATDKEIKLLDGKGLYVRCYTSGRKVFVFRYKIKGKTRWMELEDYPKMTLDEGRKQAAAYKVKARKGIDPIVELAEEKMRSQLKTELLKKEHVDLLNTVSKVALDYFARQIKPRFKRPDEWLSMLNKNIIPYIGDVPVKSVKRDQIANLLNTIVDRGSRVRANRTLAVVKQIFRYAVEQGYIDASPAALITRNSVGGTERSRDRTLDFKEICDFWRVIDDRCNCNISWQTRLTFKFLLLTGQRVGEILLAEWTHIDRNKKLWIIPKGNTKAGRSHQIPLSDFALELLSEAAPISGELNFIFASSSNPEKPITVRSVSKALRRLFEQNLLKMEPFTPHDIRRSVATRLGDIKVAPHIVEKILNHKMDGVMAVYNRQEYLPERKEALGNWSKYLNNLLKSDNVVFLGQKVEVS